MKRSRARGPDEAPTPSEVEQGPEPMAVANDKQTTNDAFRPTTAEGPGKAKARDEEMPEWTPPDAQGWRRLRDDDEA